MTRSDSQAHGIGVAPKTRKVHIAKDPMTTTMRVVLEILDTAKDPTACGCTPGPGAGVTRAPLDHVLLLSAIALQTVTDNILAKPTSRVDSLGHKRLDSARCATGLVNLHRTGGIFCRRLRRNRIAETQQSASGVLFD